VDTRCKIVDASQAAKIAKAGATVVVGYFDPMIAWHSLWLTSFKKPDRSLLVLIATPGNCILPGRARAELVAAVRVVDYVSEARLEIAGAIDVRSQDRELFQDLLQLVHSRQSSATPA
jgi:hypothetical protein